MPKPETLTPHQLTLARARLRKHYREGTLTQTAIDLLETIPGWKWEPNKPKTTEQFKAELKEINLNIEVVGEYTTNNNPIKVRCKKCEHTWSPLPNSLLQGTGCPKCYINSRRKTTKHFKAELKEINPTIEIIGDYVGALKPIKVRCKKCNHIWSPTPSHLLESKGCPECAGNAHKTTEQFKSELAKANPNIEVIGEYMGALTPIKVCCKVCNHTWSPKSNDLLRSKGCPKCANQKRCTVIRCVETGKIYSSQKEAVCAVGLKISTPINHVLHGRAKTAAGYHWEYTDTT